MITIFSSVVFAASLDNVEVGGVWGTPLAENPTAIWWNPAGLSRVDGTQVLIEGAPTFGKVSFDRVDEYNPGSDTYRMVGVLPFAGVASNFGVPGLGVGAGLIVPYVRGGEADGQPGVGSFHMRGGSIRALQGTLAVGYQPKGVPISLGGAASFVRSEWSANLDMELTTALDKEIAALGQDSGYTDAQIEDPDYTANLDFPGLADNAFTFSAGLRADLDPFKISLAYVSGTHVDNRGDATLTFGCPPQEDTLGRFGAEAYGLCYSTLLANAQVSYDLPGRIQGAIAYAPDEKVAVQLMGAYVFWSQYRDFDITVSGVEDRNELANPNTAGMVNQHRLWARDNVDAWWIGSDVKARVHDRVLVGGRFVFDHHAVPDVALSPNNVDHDALALTPMVSVDAHDNIRLTLSYGHTFFTTRTLTTSGFGVTLDEASRKDDRYFYPTMNGTYAGSIDRVALVVHGRFGVPVDKAPL